MAVIERTRELDILQGLVRRHLVVGITGARQVGKTTLAYALAKRINIPVSFYDLENPEDMARLSDPMRALKRLRNSRWPDILLPTWWICVG